MPLLTYNVPILNQPNSTEAPKIRDGLQAIKDEYNSNIAAILGAWKPLTSWHSKVIAGLVTATTYYPEAGGNSLVISGTGGTNGAQNPFYLDPADYLLTGYTTKIRLRVVVETNATAPAVNFTLGLYSITASAGGAGANALTLSNITNATAINTPGASSRNNQTSTEITMPAAGYVIAGLTLSGTTAASSQEVVSWDLQFRHV